MKSAAMKSKELREDFVSIADGDEVDYDSDMENQP